MFSSLVEIYRQATDRYRGPQGYKQHGQRNSGLELDEADFRGIKESEECI